jgi:hypothetical protein
MEPVASRVKDVELPAAVTEGTRLSLEPSAPEGVITEPEPTKTSGPGISANPPAVGLTLAAVPLEPAVESLRAEIPAPRDEPPLVGVSPPYILPPAEVYAGEDLHMITVILRTCSDKVRDNLRLRQCYGILISYSGHDRFALQIFERNRGYRIEFPNYTTLYSPELVGRLASIVGVDNVIVEPLRLH